MANQIVGEPPTPSRSARALSWTVARLGSSNNSKLDRAGIQTWVSPIPGERSGLFGITTHTAQTFPTSSLLAFF